MTGKCLWDGFRRGRAIYREVQISGAGGTHVADRNPKRIAIHFFTDFNGPVNVNPVVDNKAKNGIQLGYVDVAYNGAGTQDVRVPGRLSITQAEFGDLATFAWIAPSMTSCILAIIEVIGDEYTTGNA